MPRHLVAGRVNSGMNFAPSKDAKCLPSAKEEDVRSCKSKCFVSRSFSSGWGSALSPCHSRRARGKRIEVFEICKYLFLLSVPHLFWIGALDPYKMLSFSFCATYGLLLISVFPPPLGKYHEQRTKREGISSAFLETCSGLFSKCFMLLFLHL